MYLYRQSGSTRREKPTQKVLLIISSALTTPTAFSRFFSARAPHYCSLAPAGGASVGSATGPKTTYIHDRGATRYHSQRKRHRGVPNARRRQHPTRHARTACRQTEPSLETQQILCAQSPTSATRKLPPPRPPRLPQRLLLMPPITTRLLPVGPIWSKMLRTLVKAGTIVPKKFLPSRPLYTQITVQRRTKQLDSIQVRIKTLLRVFLKTIFRAGVTSFSAVLYRRRFRLGGGGHPRPPVALLAHCIELALCGLPLHLLHGQQADE